MAKHLEREIEILQNKLLSLATLVEEQVTRAIEAASGRLDGTTRMFQELIGGAAPGH